MRPYATHATVRPSSQRHHQIADERHPIEPYAVVLVLYLPIRHQRCQGALESLALALFLALGHQPAGAGAQLFMGNEFDAVLGRLANLDQSPLERLEYDSLVRPKLALFLRLRRILRSLAWLDDACRDDHAALVLPELDLDEAEAVAAHVSASRCLVTVARPGATSISVSVAARRLECPLDPLAASFPLWWTIMVCAPVAERRWSQLPTNAVMSSGEFSLDPAMARLRVSTTIRTTRPRSCWMRPILSRSRGVVALGSRRSTLDRTTATGHLSGLCVSRHAQMRLWTLLGFSAAM
jgi:hypothetical protein